MYVYEEVDADTDICTLQVCFEKYVCKAFIC